jgi:hypothetical protein
MVGKIRVLSLVLGALLIAVSSAAVVQSIREYFLWERGERRFSEESFLKLPIQFQERTFDIRDDQPTDSTYSEEEYEGTVELVMDGKPIGPRSRAMVRRGRKDIGRYHLWIDAWLFKDRQSGRTSLWLVRRLEVQPGASARYEVTTVADSGSVQTQVLRGWDLGASYPLFRSTQFIRSGLLSGVSLSMLDAFYFWPILSVFPVGSLVLGVWLVRRSRSSMVSRVAA